MKREENIRKSEVGSRKPEVGSRNFSALSFVGEFIQRIKEDSKRGGIIEYRLTIEDLWSGAKNQVSHSLFLIPYFLFLELWLKPISDNISSFRQLKLTANDKALRKLSALSLSVEFIQQIKEDTKRGGNIEYRISNIEFRSGAANQVSGKEQRAGSKEQRASNQNQVLRIEYQTSSIQPRFDKATRNGSAAFASLTYPVTNENSTVFHKNQFSFKPHFAGWGAPCRQFKFAGDFLSIIILKMRELKQVLTKKERRLPMKHTW